ncbi:MAG: PIN domain-containing protein [Balneolales bacterium]
MTSPQTLSIWRALENKILLDTGSLVAMLDRNDAYHVWAVDQTTSLKPPFLICEAVLTEAFFILRRGTGTVKPLLRLLSSGRLAVNFSYGSHAEGVNELMGKYADRPISFADACLVRMAELTPNARIFTLDNDFEVYRKNGNQIIQILAPF